MQGSSLYLPNKLKQRKAINLKPVSPSPQSKTLEEVQPRKGRAVK